MGSTAEIKTSFSFVKGFITEASALTYPEDASQDEENFDLKIDGSRRKRQGFDYEEGFRIHNAGDPEAFDQNSVDTFLWEAVGEVGGLDFLIVQQGHLLKIFDISDTSVALSTTGFYQIIDLNKYLVGGIKDVGRYSVSITSGKGDLFINSEVTEPLFVEYNKDWKETLSSPFSVYEYKIFIRDFEGAEEGTQVDLRPPVLTPLHHYNLRNQGWPTSLICSTDDVGSSVLKTNPITYTDTTIGAYPSNADVVYLGKLSVAETPQAVNSYWPGELEKNIFGSTQAPRGKFILNAMYKDRSAVSGIDGIAVESEDTRPEAVAFYSGRTFLGHKSSLYFSQVLSKLTKAGKCHSEADPSAEDINQVLATDGGVIEIPDVGLIKQLLPLEDVLVVLGTNGVWIVSGSGDPFSATNHQVRQISSIGVTDNKSGLLVETSILYTTASGIYAISSGDSASNFVVENLTEGTINTYYLATVQASQATIKGVYDPTTRKVLWLWNNSDESYRFFDILLFDMSLKAFHKYRLNKAVDQAPFLASAFTTPRIGATIETFGVVDSLGNQVVDSLGNNLVTNKSKIVTLPSQIKFLCYKLNFNTFELGFTFCQVNNTDMVDWVSESGSGGSTEYEAYLRTGFEHGGDIMRFKQAPVLQSVFNRTESKFIDNGSGGVTLDNQSSCLLSAAWDWTDNPVTGKVTEEREVYRFKRPILWGSVGDTFNNGYPVTTSRTKVRGRGRALSLQFRSPPGKHAEILGWSFLFSGNTAV